MTTDEPRPGRWMLWPLLASLLVFGVALTLVLVLPASSNRMAIDDFCYGADWQDRGLFGVQSYLWKVWSGRVMATALITAASYFARNNGSLATYTWLTFLLLYASATGAARRTLRVPWPIAAIIGAFLASLLLLLTPDRNESWYWLAGSTTYLWPVTMVGAMLFFGHGRGRPAELVALALCSFCAATGNETFGFMLTAVCACVAGSSLVTQRQWSRRALVELARSPRTIAFVGVAVGFLLMVAAPGNANRQLSMSRAEWLPAFGLAAATQSDLYLAMARAQDTLLYASLALLTYVIAWYGEPRPSTPPSELVGKAVAIMLALLASSLLYGLPAARSMSTQPPQRSNVTVAFIWVMATISLAHVLAPLVRSYGARAVPALVAGVAALCVLSVGIGQLRLTWPLYGYAREYAAVYDANYVKLKAAQASPPLLPLPLATLPDPGPLHSAQVSPDAKDWVNGCMARFFKLRHGVRR